MTISDQIRFVGVNDHEIDLFEGQYRVPNGMSYNSYVILDKQIAVMDSVDAHFGAQWLENIAGALAGRTPDYLVVQHMEPDHSANVAAFVDAYPQAKIVATAKAFAMMKQFFGTDFPERQVVAAEGSTLALGQHTLHFVLAPMVHWPEVMVSYESSEKVLFSADAFGKFGALDAPEDDWACEARRYYFGIVGKYGIPVQALLRKAGALDIQTICPLHGPVLTGDLTPYLSLYQTWSSYQAESQGVAVFYAGAYGHTRAAALLLADELRARGCEAVTVTDLARCDMAEAVEDAFRYDRLALASITYNGDVFPFMREFLHELSERAFQSRTVGLMENGSWAPAAAKQMRALLAPCKNLTFAPTTVTVRSAPDDAARAQIKALAAELWP